LINYSYSSTLSQKRKICFYCACKCHKSIIIIEHIFSFTPTNLSLKITYNYVGAEYT